MTPRETKRCIRDRGVANVHKRLQLTYGKSYGLTVESELGKYTRVHIRLPKEE